MQPEDALDSWRDWDGELRSRPVLLRPLTGGRSNRSFLLDSNTYRMVLRINGTESVLPGSNRNNEVKIWKAASEQGIAPPLLHIDKQNRFLVSTYIDNSLPSKAPHNQAMLDQACELLKRCHHLDIEAPAIDYVSHVEHYWRTIAKRDTLPVHSLRDRREPMRTLIGELTGSGAQTGLCHHDPVVANFVGGPDRLYLIDWEYAAHGLLVMDYAALVVEWGADVRQISEQSGIMPGLLTRAITLYRYICDLWEWVAFRPAADPKTSLGSAHDLRSKST